MTLKDILNQFEIENKIDDKIIKAFQNDKALRIELVKYSNLNKNRDFALALLNSFISVRRHSTEIATIEDLMFACFNLALQSKIEDCLKIWEAKNVDFDTYCGLDIQLLPFAGVKTTIEFLKMQQGADAKKALLYINECDKCGDFNHQSEYFSPNAMPWFL